MLLNMHIKNIALIDDLDICFEEKLNIMTGETGAGKSIIIGSLDIGLGGKFSKELLRDNNEEGLVELLFSVDSMEIENQLKAIDIEPTEEGEILITRRCNQSRTINRVNDRSVTTSKLKEIAAILIDLHAQHEQQSLLKQAKHLEILDKFGGDIISELKSEVAKLFDEYNYITKQIIDNTIDENEKYKQLDFLQFQINEIEQARLVENEDTEVELVYNKIKNSKEIVEVADDIYKLTGFDSNCCSNQISKAINQIKRIINLDADIQPLHDSLYDIESLINDFNNDLNVYISSMEFDENEFVEIENRLDLINNIKSKYGKTIEDINNFLKNTKTKYDSLIENDKLLNDLKTKQINIEEQLIIANEKLSNNRRLKADKLCEIIKQTLIDLNFNSVEFDMEFQKINKFTSNGTDNAFFVISTNVGEKKKPLYEVASGGELSRVMLAIKACLANEDEIPTLIFDEIDVGISGITAKRVANLLSEICKNHQIICITHLPQIASMANHHYLIEKNVENNKTFTNIKKLDKKGEIDEIARLLGGDNITEKMLESAKEMKGLADRTKLY